jgi:hypothetical protein
MNTRFILENNHDDNYNRIINNKIISINKLIILILKEITFKISV